MNLPEIILKSIRLIGILGCVNTIRQAQAGGFFGTALCFIVELGLALYKSYLLGYAVEPSLWQLPGQGGRYS